MVSGLQPTALWLVQELRRYQATLFPELRLGEELKLRVKGTGFAVTQRWLQAPAWPLPSCVTLGKSLSVHGIQFLGMRLLLTS